MDSNKEHPVALRVMRLTKPSIVTSFPIPAEKHDLLSITLGQSNKNLPDLASGEILLLPQSFGSIYLGETFVSYLSVINESNMDVANVSLKADLQTGSQRMPLTNTDPVSYLSTGSAIDEVINHEVKELGTHILVCVVSYKRPDGDVKNFRKFFKFQVLKPLEVKTKFYNIENNEVYLETQIQNITQSPICLEKVNLDPTSMYSVTPLNSSLDDSQSKFGSHSYMKPNEVWQYLYHLKIKPECQMKVFSEAASAIGKLDIAWKSSLGERGRLQTSQLQRAVTPAVDIHLTVKHAPNEIKLNQPFSITCSITNYSEQSKKLLLKYGLCSNILWRGVSGKNLKNLAPKESVDVDFDLLAISPGVQPISGLEIFDTDLNRPHNFDEIHHVLVFAS